MGESLKREVGRVKSHQCVDPRESMLEGEYNIDLKWHWDFHKVDAFV